MTSPKGNAVLVEALGSSLKRGGNALEAVPGLLKRLLAEGSWQEFITQRGELVQHERFAEFVTTPPLRGIGASVDLIRRIVVVDSEALDLLDRALQNPVGRPEKGNNVPLSPAGNTKEKALRRLRKDAPELHAEVLAGKLTAHAAMVEAGFRPKTFTVRADSAEAVAKALRRQLDADTLEAVRRLLESG